MDLECCNDRLGGLLAGEAEMLRVGWFFRIALSVELLGRAGLVLAAPATFSAREREQTLGEVYSPLNPAGAVSGAAKEIQMDPALARVLKPNTFCVGPGGSLISNCGVSAGNETSDWSGGIKKRDINIPGPNALRTDLIQSIALGNQFPSTLSSPGTQVATTYVYADAGAAAGISLSLGNVTGALIGYKLAIDSLNAQVQRDPVVGELAAQKLNGCLQKALNGGVAGGNSAQAWSWCMGDRMMSAGAFALSVGPGATLEDVPDHAPVGGVSVNSPPSMPGNQHSVWAEIFNPLIYKAPTISSSPSQASKADYIALLADAKRLTGDVVYTETVAGTGNTRIETRRERSNNPADDPAEVYRQILKNVWKKLNGVLWKMCDYLDKKQNVSVTSHDPFPLSVYFGFSAADFWSSINGGASGWTAPTQTELADLSFQSFLFKAVGADLLFASYLKTQEHVMPAATTNQDPMSGQGRKLDCQQFETASGKPGQFETLLSDSGSWFGGYAFSPKKLKEWRQTLAELSIRIALGQWLGQLRAMHSFLLSTAGGMAGGTSLISSQLAERMILETAGVNSPAELEESFHNNRAELRQVFERLQTQYAMELGQGSGTVSEMFKDSQGIGSGDTALSGPST
ncbi:MAG: hypothetical protein K1X79_13370 [Oligoflexia bacterium]|nr:hypothetical protein [Oligoflexia bacterium]